MESCFGFPAEARHVLEKDNTGIFKQPIPGSNPIEPHNRLWHKIHNSAVRDLQGNALNDLADRFMKNLEAELSALGIGYDEWTEIPDLYKVVQRTVFKASTSAICGPHLFQIDLDFPDNFWEFDVRMPGLFKGLPRWMIPKSFQIRDKLISSVIKWHRFASEYIDAGDPQLEGEEFEEYFGSRLMRERQLDYKPVDGLTLKARAASDFGMIWGANGNIVPIIGWEMLDTLLRPDVLAQVRAEIEDCSTPSKKGVEALDMPKLLANPLLQSIYSEELRLRNGVIIQRVPVVDNFKIDAWKFPKGQMITTSSWHEQRDRTVRNGGPVNGEFHSVEDFWAERFLVYPNDPNSGPRKPSPDSKVKEISDEKTLENKPKFTTDSVTGSFFPYGGGQKICPGRFYAKQEAIGGLAIFLTMFDIELMEKDKLPKPNLDYFPFGVIPPVGKIPARMRRRRCD